MKRIFKYIVMSVLGIALIGSGIGFYLYNKPHRDFANLAPDYIIEAQSLMMEYQSDEALANEKYLGKILVVTGEVVTIESGLNGSLSYSLEDALFRDYMHS